MSETLTSTADLLRQIASILEEEGVESRYVSILANHGEANMPLVAIDESAFRTMFFGAKVTGKQEGPTLTLRCEKYGVRWQTCSYQLQPLPKSVEVQL
jgi:hypothetical protein